ncbi:MAG: hypothetical protein E7575_02915 [Ruminococcaceae bacterium]|nr:hypothetical protein [Oscillospiraceae bacterium]
MESILIVISALLVDNFLLTKLFGIESIFVASEKPSHAALYGGLVTGITVVSGTLILALYNGILVKTEMTSVVTFASVIIINTLICAVQLLSARVSKKAHSAVEATLPMVSGNCVILGAVLLCIEQSLSFGMSVLFLLSAGIGFTFTLFVFCSVQKRLENTLPAESFRGIPILLVSAGLAAMAFSGFYGISF